MLPPFYGSLLLAWREVGGHFSNSLNSLSIGRQPGVDHPVESLTCKFVYQYILSLKVSQPHCVAKFSPVYGAFYWPSTWKQLFLMPLDRKAIDINWKICHGVLYTAARLASFGYNHPTACFCSFHTETSEHLFFSCPLARSGLDWIQSLLFRASPLAVSLTVWHLLFGFSPDEMRSVSCLFVYLLFVCK